MRYHNLRFEPTLTSFEDQGQGADRIDKILFLAVSTMASVTCNNVTKSANHIERPYIPT